MVEVYMEADSLGEIKEGTMEENLIFSQEPPIMTLVIFGVV